MNRRRKLLIGVCIGAPVAAIAAACTFPEVDFADSALEAGAEGSVGTSSGSLADTGAGDTGGIFLEDGGLAEDVVSRPVDSLPDAAGCDARCDCDGDGYLDKFKPFCDAGPAPGDDAGSILPGDCDDLDPLAHPGQASSDAVPRAGSPKPGDWNCDGTVTKGYLENFACGGLAATGCPNNGTNGKYDVPVECGDLGDLYECVAKDLVNCEKSLKAQKKQLCK